MSEFLIDKMYFTLQIILLRKGLERNDVLKEMQLRNNFY